MIEERLANIEAEVADLKSQVARIGSKENWIDQITGSFKGDSDFAEILRLGREIRQADRPDAQ
jgi:hypothetical protein